MNLQSILTQNQQVQSRQETLDNIVYSVFPVVMLTEGVHAGSGGPVLYTAQTLTNFHQTWNGTPVTLKHPDLNGTPVSANHPEIYKSQVVGTVFNTTFQDNKLKAEIWLNEQKLDILAPGLLNGLRIGMKLDVSTGLYDEGSKVTGNFNGQDYVAVAHNIRPDHLALLPGETGACSWKDGCGVRVNQDKGGGMKRTTVPGTKTNELNINNEENEMKTMRECCPAKVDELITANAKFQETDKEMLLNMSEDDFARMIDIAAPEIKEVVKVVEKIVEKEVKVNAESKTFDELLANADPKLQESIQYGQQLIAKERENLVTRIKTNKANVFTDVELASFNLDMLGKLAAMAPAAVNWTANAGVQRVITGEGPDPLPEMEDVWRTPAK